MGKQGSVTKISSRMVRPHQYMHMRESCLVDDSKYYKERVSYLHVEPYRNAIGSSILLRRYKAAI